MHILCVQTLSGRCRLTVDISLMEKLILPPPKKKKAFARRQTILQRQQKRRTLAMKFMAIDD